MVAEESRPIPDPTVLTTEQLLREIGNVREVTKGELDVLRERLRGIDTATELLGESMNRVPSEVDKQISHLRELDEEKFRSIAVQFLERDTRSERESKDNKVAVDAAFAAQKEAASKEGESNQKAIDKSEKATAETLNKQADLFKSKNDALDAQIADLKDRVGRLESTKAGGLEAVASRRDEQTLSRQGLAIFVSIAALLVTGLSIALALKP